MFQKHEQDAHLQAKAPQLKRIPERPKSKTVAAYQKVNKSLQASTKQSNPLIHLSFQTMAETKDENLGLPNFIPYGY